MFGNLGNLLGDANFWGGVAEGFTTQIEKQEDRKAKDVRELRNFGIERGLQITEENTKNLSETESQIIELSSLIAGKRKVNDKAVREGALLLLETYGSVAAAAPVAKKLSVQYNTYGRDPIKALGYTDEDFTDRATPTLSDISRKYTKLKPLPNLAASQVDATYEMTALDKIFGGKTTTELAMEGVERFVGPVDTQTEQAIPTALETDFDSELILDDNIESELKRMYTLKYRLENIPENQQIDTHDARLATVGENIKMLRIAKDKYKNKEPLTSSQLKSHRLEFTGLVQDAAGLSGDYGPDGLWIPRYEQDEILRTSMDAGNRYVNAYNISLNKGYEGIDPLVNEGNDTHPYIFVIKAAELGRHVKIVEPTEDAPGYLTLGGSVYDRNSEAFQSAISGTRSLPNQTQSSTASVQPPPNIGANTVTPSARITNNIQTFNSASNAANKKAAAKAVMAAIKVGVPGKSQAEYEAIFEQMVGTSFAPYK